MDEKYYLRFEVENVDCDLLDYDATPCSLADGYESFRRTQPKKFNSFLFSFLIPVVVVLLLLLGTRSRFKSW